MARHTELPSKSWFWDGKDESGKKLAEGIYIIQARQGAFKEYKKILHLR